VRSGSGADGEPGFAEGSSFPLLTDLSEVGHANADIERHPPYSRRVEVPVNQLSNRRRRKGVHLDCLDQCDPVGFLDPLPGGAE
jgi:hypothetical protein